MQEILTEHGIFTSNKETNQTAEEVYAAWLSNKDKPKPPTAEERLEAVEQAMLAMMEAMSGV